MHIIDFRNYSYLLLTGLLTESQIQHSAIFLAQLRIRKGSIINKKSECLKFEIADCRVPFILVCF